MNILSIGNSFSQDAQRYLCGIAKADGVELQCFNLYIGGCSLGQHYRNMLADVREYELEMNGTNTHFKISLQEALMNREWDVVTLQQVSKQSNDYGTYQPYLEELAKFVRQYAPKAKIAFHQTWAYEQGSQRLESEMGYTQWQQMTADIVKASAKAARAIEADYLIPAGQVFYLMLENNAGKMHRDSFHASLGLGRYALGLIWYRTLTGKDIMGNTFVDFDEEVSAQQMQLAKRCVMEIAARYTK